MHQKEPQRFSPGFRFVHNVEKINTHLEQKEKAMEKSRGLLFAELCQYLSLQEEEMNQKWRKMKEEEKWVLVSKFVDDWGVYFHPLSVRSVKEMVDEYLQDGKSPSPRFPGLKRMLGISDDT
ncbi:protein RMD5-like protein A-like [Hibiscus syriacus]|uniref:Protein RMD5-like protein A-like n=1 Tax=Hibiscus syriacus TaxID=106335 RepID=A0A6A3B091_HIBSY|nr:protein RMD5-like protein A-like [Hibiscus syriacus]